MKILLDTHIIIWHLMDDLRLSKKNSDLLEDEAVEKVVSMISLYEIAIKTNIGKLKINVSIDVIIPTKTTLLNLSMPHFTQYQSLPLHHRDPFDRMLVAQAQVEGLPLMTDDPSFANYDVPLIF